MHQAHQLSRRHNDRPTRRSNELGRQFSPIGDPDVHLSLDYVQGMADSESFWFVWAMFLGGLFWGSVLTWWFC